MDIPYGVKRKKKKLFLSTTAFKFFLENMVIFFSILSCSQQDAFCLLYPKYSLNCNH